MDWKAKTILFYIGCGLVLGAIAGIMTVNNAEKNDKQIDPTLKDGAKICVEGLKSLKKIVL